VNTKSSKGLSPAFSPLGIWAISIGTSIGWGSFIITCNTYLQKAGILGTAFGLLIGMGIILVITWNLQYMIRSRPDAGGIYSFERSVGGKDLGFLALWFVLLGYLAVLWANITAVPLFARFFLGSTFQFGFHYQIFGYEVWMGEVLLSVGSIGLVGFLCAHSSRLPDRIMIAAALVFALGFTVCAVMAILRHERAFSYAPLYSEQSSAISQIVRIAVISPWAFIGFENVSHFSEEYRFPVRRIRAILIFSVVVTTVLYLFVSLLSISAYPPEYESWLDYIRDMGNLDGPRAVPAFYAAEHYLGRTGVVILMLALLGVILTSLIGNLLALSRVLYAAGREGNAPSLFSELNGKGIPQKAIYAVVLLSAFIPLLGRTAIGWIVDVTTLGATLIYGFISQAVFHHARRAHRRLETVTGIIGLVLMLCFVLLTLVPGLLPFHAMETESYFLFIVWSLLGLAYFRWLLARDRDGEHNLRFIVWILFLFLVLFASIMCASRAT
jgi:amino acid transporter